MWDVFLLLIHVPIQRSYFGMTLIYKIRIAFYLYPLKLWYVSPPVIMLTNFEVKLAQPLVHEFLVAFHILLYIAEVLSTLYQFIFQIFQIIYLFWTYSNNRAFCFLYSCFECSNLSSSFSELWNRIESFTTDIKNNFYFRLCYNFVSWENWNEDMTENILVQI